MALGMRCPRGHSYVASDIVTPGMAGCPICRAERRAALLLRAARYAEALSEPEDAQALKKWAEAEAKSGD